MTQKKNRISRGEIARIERSIEDRQFLEAVGEKTLRSLCDQLIVRKRVPSWDNRRSGLILGLAGIEGPAFGSLLLTSDWIGIETGRGRLSQTIRFDWRISRFVRMPN